MREKLREWWASFPGWAQPLIGIPALFLAIFLVPLLLIWAVGMAGYLLIESLFAD